MISMFRGWTVLTAVHEVAAVHVGRLHTNMTACVRSSDLAIIPDRRDSVRLGSTSLRRSQ